MDPRRVTDSERGEDWERYKKARGYDIKSEAAATSPSPATTLTDRATRNVKTIKCRRCGELHLRGKTHCRSNPEERGPVQPQQKSPGDSTVSEIFIESYKNLNNHELSDKKEANKNMFKTKECPARVYIKRRGKSKKIRKKRTDPLLACKNINFTQNILTLMVGCTISTTKPRNNVELFPHHVYDKESGRWTEKGPREKPYVKLRIEFDRQSASDLNMNVPHQQTRPFTWSGMADTGPAWSWLGETS